MITNKALGNTFLIHIITIFVVRTLRSTLINLKVYDKVLLTIVITLYIRFSEGVDFINGHFSKTENS